MLVCPSLVEAQTGYAHVSSSNAGDDAFSGLNINLLIGADRFYDEGFTGTSALLGNIEGGESGNSHLAMTNVTQQVQGAGSPGTLHNHAGAVTHAMSGSLGGPLTDSNYWGYGVSYNSETWSGDIATGFNDNGSYQLSWASIASTYSTLLETGINGQTVDVFNSSWGFSNPLGIRRDTIGVDALINRNGTVGVVSAGNDGPEDNSVGGYGAGYNSITVGATGPDTGTNPYGAVASFSSRGANDFSLATSANTWTTISAATAQRAAVDIVAPGQSMTLANPATADNWFGFNWQGTSFAAPTVAGGAGLMVDAGKTIYGTEDAIDGRVIKAALLNSAAKLDGWDNGQIDIAGNIVTTQALDFEQGAGALDLDQAFDQYVDIANGGGVITAGVSGLEQGDLGNVGAVGWDLGEVWAEDSNFYFIDSILEGGTEFSVTTTWFADRDPGELDDFFGVEEQHLANIDLRVFEFDNLVDRNIIGTVGESLSLYNVVEHLSFDLLSSGFYGIEVNYDSAHWNFTSETSELYGLSWSSVVAVPEPTSYIVVGLGALFFVSKRRRTLQ